MGITDIPLIDFFELCLESAKEQGYIWTVCLVSREADSRALYQNLIRDWDSLHDLTGDKILFMFTGENQYNSVIRVKGTSYGVSNPYISFVQDPELACNYSDYSSKATIEFRDKPRYLDFQGNGKENEKLLIQKQTLEIGTLKKYFNIMEKSLPCLVFTSTHTKKHIIMPIRGDNLYFIFKKIIMELEDDWNQYDTFINQINQCCMDIYNKKNEIYAMKKGNEYLLQLEEIYSHCCKLERELNDLLEKIENSDVKKSIETALRIKKRNINITWRLMDRETRRLVNKFLDLCEKYNFDELQSCRDKFSNSKKVIKENELVINKSHIQKQECENNINKLLNAMEAKIQNQIFTPPEIIRTESDDIIEKRFKIAVSFAGEYRELVEKVVEVLVRFIDRKKILYDKYINSIW